MKLYLFSHVYIFRLSSVNFNIEKKELKNTYIVIYIIILTLINYILRAYIPPGKEFFHLQLAYFPQYISMFTIGLIASKNDWFSNFSDKFGLSWLKITLVVTLLLFYFTGLYDEHTVLIYWGINFKILLLYSYESFFSVGANISLLYFFRKKLNKQGVYLKALSSGSYGAYIIHAPIIVLLAYEFRFILINPFIKFIIISSIGVLVSFFFSYIIKKALISKF